MNITFLLGNGFDIGLGLKTRYENFYNEYLKTQATDNENINSFKTMLSNRNTDEQKKIIDWSDFEKAFGEHSTDFTINKKREYIDRFENFIVSFNAYLEEEEKKIDYSDKKKISDTMKKDVTTYFYIRERDKLEIEALYKRTPGQRIYNFISYNYTKIIDECAKILNESLNNDNSRTVGKVLHIHGFIEENMIMGVNDASQITNKVFANDQNIVREIVKPQQNIDSRSNYESEAISIINSSNIICTYGMSIGETDKKWWNIISNWLSNNSNRLFVILAHDDKYNKRFPHQQTEVVDKIVNKFLSFSNLPSEKLNNIKDRIFVGVNYDVFEMNLCRQEENEEITEKNKILATV